MQGLGLRPGPVELGSVADATRFFADLAGQPGTLHLQLVAQTCLEGEQLLKVVSNTVLPPVSKSKLNYNTSSSIVQNKLPGKHHYYSLRSLL